MRKMGFLKTSCQLTTVGKSSDKFQDRFGPNRTLASLQLRAKKLGTSSQLRSCRRWTAEELDFLKSLPASKNWSKIMKDFESRFGYQRSMSNLATKYGRLNAESGIDKNQKWTEEEISFLKELILASKPWDTILSDYRRAFGPHRTLTAIKGKLTEIRRDIRIMAETE